MKGVKHPELYVALKRMQALRRTAEQEPGLLRRAEVSYEYGRNKTREETKGKAKGPMGLLIDSIRDMGAEPMEGWVAAKGEERLDLIAAPIQELIKVATEWKSQELVKQASENKETAERS